MSTRISPSCWLSLAIAFAAVNSARGETWRLSDANLELRFDDQSAELTVRPKPTGREWRQVSAGHAVRKVEQRDGQLVIQFDGTPAFEARLRLAANADLECEVTAASDAALATLLFPGPFETPGEDWNFVLPISEGVLLPARDVPAVLRGNRNLPIYNMSGLIMPWIGVVDPALQAGYMMIVDTPFDAAIRLSDRTTRPAPAPVWQAEMGRFGYTRHVRYHFFAEGGYVAQAGHYREHVRATREFSTLRERARERPHIDQLIGAVHIYTWDDGRDLALAHELREAGIDRAWIGWDPSHPPYPAKGYDEGLKKLGFLAGVYDLYRDCYDDEKFAEKAATSDVLKSLWLHRYPYPGLFEKIVARVDGDKPMEIRLSGDVGIMRYWTCTKAQAPYVPRRITRELETYPHNAVFVDVTLAAGPFECHSSVHPMTRREDVAARLAIHDTMARDLKMVVGSEWGADYGVAHTEFMHGLVTLSTFWGEGTRDAGSPTYLGDWKNTVVPSMVLGEARPSETYWKYGLGPEYRVPLFELVYHDCTVASWRWDDNSHKMPDAWARKDLFTALYAVAPQWNLDRATWRKHRDRFVASFRSLGPVLRAVGYEAMTGHRFLSEDRLLQETTFASGHRVVANFADAPRRAGETSVPAGGFVLLAP